MLNKGDIVELVAPSSGFSEEEYISCLKIVENLGLSVSTEPYSKLIDKSFEFLSNDANIRFAHLEKALNNPKSKALWFMAGGYGSYQLLDMLGKIPAPVTKKIVIGFSDNTPLINYFTDRWNWHCIYGPTLLQIVNKKISESAVDMIKKALFENTYADINLFALNSAAKKNNIVAGKILGGCLSLVQTSVGTPQCINTKGKIILLEDDKFENAGRIDRAFNHLARAKFFEGCAAVVLGSFFENEFSANESKFLLAVESLKKNLDGNNIPLLKAENIGHCRDMISIPFGIFANIKLGDNPMLKFGL
jgi:muramoyltetrapeptide carboxypeptidase